MILPNTANTHAPEGMSWQPSFYHVYFVVVEFWCRTDKLFGSVPKNQILIAKVAKNLSFRVAESEKVTKNITFYVILVVWDVELEDFCVILHLQSD